MIELNPSHNRSGTLQEVLLLDVRDVCGISFSSAHLIFTSRDARRCAVYAAIAMPYGPGPHPLVIHAPGGGQTVAEEDIAFWVANGFACIAFDWQVGLFDHDPKRKSIWPAGVVAQSEPFVSWHQFILPLAVEAIGVLIDWAATFPVLDADRVGMTGISWGGYLTWLANAYEPRLKCVAPVYGCGGLFEKDRPGGPPKVSLDIAERWRVEWDPRFLAQRQLSPVCWVSGTNDFFGFPKDADALLAEMALPHRRSHEPSLNHSVLPEDAATIVAWMRHYLADGPALPAEPRWNSLELQVDQRDEVALIEEWWTASTGSSEDYCWWPGVAPAFATAKLARVRYRCGIALTTPIVQLDPQGPPVDLGNIWADIRAGVSCRNLWKGTQLHGNSIRLQRLPGDTTRGCISDNSGKESPLILLHQFGDPRLRSKGFAGLRLHMSSTKSLPERLNILVQVSTLEEVSERHEFRGQIDVSATGAFELSLSSLTFVPRTFLFNNVRCVYLDGFPSLPLEIGPIELLQECGLS